MSRSDFLIMFPPSQLTQCTFFTIIVLRKQKMKEIATGKILKFFGRLILMSKFEFCKRRDLWTNISKHIYVPAPALGKTGIPRNRFDLLRQWIVWSE